jgi:hypothetical protein
VAAYVFLSRLLVWLGLCAGLSVVASPAFAIGTVSAGTYQATGYKTCGGGNSCSLYGFSPTKQETCTNYAVLYFSASGTPHYGTVTDVNDSKCWVRTTAGNVGVAYTDYTTQANTTFTGCPANSTGTSTCTCNANYRPNAAGTSCDAYTCTAETLGDQNFGPFSSQPLTGTRYLCDQDGANAGCTMQFDANMSMSYAEGWYLSGALKRTAVSCNGGGSWDAATSPAGTASAPGGAASTPDSSASTPSQACPAGQQLIDGVCQTPKVTSTSSTEQTTNGSGTVTGTKTTATECTGTQCTTTTTTKDGSGAVTGTTVVTAAIGDFCRQNPATAMCAVAGTSTGGSSGTGCEANPSGTGCGGTGASIGELYTGKGKTFTTVIDTFKTGMQATPIGSGVGNFFNVTAGGACPTWVWLIPYLEATVTFDFWCAAWATTALTLMGAGLMVVAGFRAFTIVVS